jgi:multiple sugar transport system permease protein
VTAIVLNELRHAKSYFRLLVYLPVMMPPVAAAFLWKWFYTPGQAAACSTRCCTRCTCRRPSGCSPHSLRILCLVLFSTWMNMGSGVLIYLAALQGIPGELYEAAELDGAGILKRIWHVTDPADPADPLPDADAADRRHHAGLPRAVHPHQPAARTTPPPPSST